MNLEFFIAKRLITVSDSKNKISTPIVNIAIAAIAIGIIMMHIAVATGLGLQQKIREKIAAFNGHIVVTNYDSNEAEATLVPIENSIKTSSFFNSLPDISNVQAVATKTGVIRTATDFEGIVFKGVGKDYNWDFMKEYLIQGNLPNLNDATSNEVLISQIIANRLQLKIGSSFRTYFMKTNGYNVRSFKVVGIFNSGFQEFDRSIILGDLRHVQRLNKWSPFQVGAFEVFINDFNELDDVGKKLYQELPPALDSKTIREKFTYIFDWLKLFDINIVVILVIMILVATINMVVALLVLILERTQMIGILKAIGASSFLVRKIFLYNALYLIGRGLFWGNLIGLSLLWCQYYFNIVQLNPENYYVDYAPVFFNWWYILLINLCTTVVCFLVLLIPSFIITRISPIRAIRYQ